MHIFKFNEMWVDQILNESTHHIKTISVRTHTRKWLNPLCGWQITSRYKTNWKIISHSVMIGSPWVAQAVSINTRKNLSKLCPNTWRFEWLTLMHLIFQLNSIYSIYGDPCVCVDAIFESNLRTSWTYFYRMQFACFSWDLKFVGSTRESDKWISTSLVITRTIVIVI